MEGLIEESLKALSASGCSSVADFLDSHHCQARFVCLGEKSSIWSAAVYENQVMHRIEFEAMRWGKEALCFSVELLEKDEDKKSGSIARCLRAVCAIPTCRDLALLNLVLTPDQLFEFCHGLGSNDCMLQSLFIDCMSFGNLFLSDNLVSVLSRNDCRIKVLTLINSTVYAHPLGYPLENPVENPLETILTCLGQNTISLTHLRLIGFGRLLLEDLGSMLQTNTSLTSLGIEHGIFKSDHFFRGIFTSLEKNLHLTSLSLRGCEGSESWSSSSVLDSLQANGMLSDLDLTGTALDGNAAIKAQLKRNHKNAERVKVLKSKGIEQVPPTAVRLFLCGLPYSGKTTLSQSIARCLRSEEGTINCFSCVKGNISMQLERTRGIEVTFLEKDGMKVSLWDMAGQTEYYSFHDQMFPNLSDRATPSFFMFVWNPIEVDAANGCEKKREDGRILTKTLEKFHEEFRYWLRFLASKTLRSETFRPRLIVAVTRADRGLPDTKSWLERKFRDLEEAFKDIIQFDMDGVFEVDARDPTKVQELASHVFTCARSVLERVPLVYQACDEARTMLANLVHTKRIAPLIPKSDFYFLCHKHLGLDSRELQEAIALSLNDSGNIIFLRSIEFVVVDTQWFCRQVMGDLLHYSVRRQSTNDRNLQGFFSLKILEKLLETQVNSLTSRGNSGLIRRLLSRYSWFGGEDQAPRVGGEVLVQLLEELHLACRRDSSQENSDIFIPASLSQTAKSKRHLIHHKRDMENITTYLGRRLQCKDSECTFLTPGLFPLLQVTFHNLFDRGGVKVDLEEDLIEFACEGVVVIIEFCREASAEEHFIDVFIQSCQDLENTLGWVHENVIDNVKRVCAEPRGIQGVELALAVIQPGSFEMEGRAAVSIEKLKDTLENFIQKAGFKDGYRNAFYTWPNKSSDGVADLLGEVVSLQVCESYERGLKAAAQDALGNIVDEDEMVFGTTRSSKEREAIYKKDCEIEKRLIEVHKEVLKIGNKIDNLRKVVLPKVQERMQELLTFVKEGEAGKLPRMFVVTAADQDGMRRRVVAAMVPGLHNVRLELLCEHRSKPHFVAGKSGLTFATLDDDALLKRGLPYINAFLKVAHVAVKVGAHLVAGIGNTIPDFTRVLALIADTSNSSASSDYSATSSRVNYQEGQQWLFDVLSKHKCHMGPEIYSIFGLRRVRYRDDSTVAWLCNEHYSQGEPWPA